MENKVSEKFINVIGLTKYSINDLIQIIELLN